MRALKIQSSNKFSNLFAQTKEISVKTFRNTSPVKPTNSADRTTGELHTSLACIILQKYFWYFPTNQNSVSCRRSNGAVWHICGKLLFIGYFGLPNILKFVGQRFLKPFCVQNVSLGLGKGRHVSTFVLKGTQLSKKCLFDLKKVSTCELLLWKASSCPKSVFLT